ncbi:MAG: FliM/FliN family flagellar motor switch protein [Deltaproteobacteria bacterium]|nr:FliM/FliN family flagellar motor switch protein [Deltaproteobacteria bacterium]
MSTENDDFDFDEEALETQNTSSPAKDPPPSPKVVNLASDVPVQMVAVLAKKAITVKDLVQLKMGQVIEFNRYPNEAIDLVANGRLMAKGELVEIDGKLGIRLIKVFE